MRLVLDTNLLVSVLLKPGSVPDRALAAIWSTGAVVLYDSRLEDEYRDAVRDVAVAAYAEAHEREGGPVEVPAEALASEITAGGSTRSTAGRRSPRPPDARLATSRGEPR